MASSSVPEVEAMRRELEAARAEEAAFDGVGDDAVRWDSAGEDSFEYDGRSEEE